MSLAKARSVQIGLDSDPANNLLVSQPTTPDGTVEALGALMNFAGMPLVGGNAIVEQGSGTEGDGEYVRFADGTQICWLNNIFVDSLSAGATASGVWTYPAGFDRQIIALASVHSSGSVGATEDAAERLHPAAAGISTTAYWALHNSGGSIPAAVMDVYAIGRWF